MARCKPPAEPRHTGQHRPFLGRHGSTVTFRCHTLQLRTVPTLDCKLGCVAHAAQTEAETLRGAAAASAAAAQASETSFPVSVATREIGPAVPAEASSPEQVLLRDAPHTTSAGMTALQVHGAGLASDLWSWSYLDVVARRRIFLLSLTACVATVSAGTSCLQPLAIRDYTSLSIHSRGSYITLRFERGLLGMVDVLQRSLAFPCSGSRRPPVGMMLPV